MKKIDTKVLQGVLLIALVVAGVAFGISAKKTSWTKEEKEIVGKPAEGVADSLVRMNPDIMRVLVVSDAADSVVLRSECRDFEATDLASEEYGTLVRRMLATVNDPSQDGVGIAAPQVGLLRRLVCVMRYDKEGKPFEAYPNIRITATRGEKVPGPEGCLSIPGYRGIVPRYRDVDITYSLLDNRGSLAGYQLRDTTETVRGYSAVIFQHECDHLDGILYPDRADSVFVYNR